MMMFTNFIKTEQLAQFYSNPDWVIIDCRFDLQQPEWGFMDYQHAHIPGAIYVDLNRDLSGPITPKSGRHPLPQPECFAQLIAKLGITPEKQVVVYDTTNGAFAARLWWMLRICKYYRAAILEGGFNKWAKENRPIRGGIESSKALLEIPSLSFDHSMYVTTEQMEMIYANPEYVIVDARSPERFRGELETIDPIAGHIPGALNRYHADNLNEDGTLKSPKQLRKEFNELLAGKHAEKCVVYCGSGVTSCFHLAVMDYCNITGAKLYVGSWSEWIRDSKRPIIAKT